MNPSIKVTGDITPAYAVLKAFAFKRININFKNRGMRVKVVFPIRDPIHRIWPSYNMHTKKNNINNEVSKSLPEHSLKRHVVARTTYDKTILELEKSFGQDQLFFGFYEELFKCDHTLRQMVEFLWINLRPANWIDVVNGGQEGSDIPDYFGNDISEKFSSTYDFIIGKFGEKRIKDIWKIYHL